jgi:hypothetical protein
MTTDIDMPTGIRDPVAPSIWLVPPWPVDASVSEIVRHFLRFETRYSASPFAKLAYFEEYAAALSAAPKFELGELVATCWHDELCRQIEECILVYRELKILEQI